MVCPAESVRGFVVVCSACRAGRDGEGPRAFSEMKSAGIGFAFLFFLKKKCCCVCPEVVPVVSVSG